MRFSRQAPNPSEFVGAVVSAIHGGAYWRSLFKFEPRDLWIGAYWDAKNIERAYAEDFVRSTYRWRVNVFVCVIPMLVFRFAFECGKPKWKRGDYSDYNAGRDKTNAHTARISELEAERDQLKAVIAQHDLCHNLHGKVDARAFADGCAAEQRKLYGCAPHADRCEALDRKNGTCSICGGAIYGSTGMVSMLSCVEGKKDEDFHPMCFVTRRAQRAEARAKALMDLLGGYRTDHVAAGGDLGCDCSLCLRLDLLAKDAAAR